MDDKWAEAIERWEPDMKPRRPQGRPLHATDFSGSLREYQPTLRERAADALAQWTGNDTREGVAKVQQFVLDPATSLYQFGRRGAEGMMGEGGLGEAAFEGLSSIPGAGKLAAPLGKAMFLGIAAKNAYKPAFRAAEAYAKEGRGAQEILRKTGLFRGPDGKWRFEISDDEAQLLRMPSAEPGRDKLADILEHPELFQNYPQLGEVPTRGIRENPLAGGATVPDPATGAPMEFLLNRQMDIPGHTPQDVLLHEAQHGVQGYEGFAQGGAPWERITPDHPARFLYEQELAKIMVDPKYKGLPRMVKESAAQDIAGRLAYKLNAGEVEANNVMQRMEMSPADRRSVPPQITEKYPAKEQIVRFGPQPPQPPFPPTGPSNQPQLPFKRGQLLRQWPETGQWW